MEIWKDLRMERFKDGNMKRILIKKLTLRYFKGVREAEYGFGDYVNVVKGKNGVGKSTIADAICWVLFGVNSEGDTKFGLKTRREDGTEIEDVEHSVEMVLTVDGEETILKRQLKDSKGNDGKVTNTYTYYLNGEAETAGDFKKKVDGICKLEAFRKCSSPTAFVEEDWKEQRRLLADMAGRPSWEEVTQGETQFDWMKGKIESQSATEIAKHIDYKRKEVRKQLDEVPVRLRELEKVLPQDYDWEQLSSAAEACQKELDKKEAELKKAEIDGTDAVAREKTRSDLDFANKRKDNMMAGARKKLYNIAEEYQKDLSEKRYKCSEARDTVADLIRKRASLETLLERLEKQRIVLEQEKMDGAALWKTVAARKWEWNDKDSFCPTCGQPLPMDRIEELKEESEKRFNAAVAEEKKKLLAKAAKLNDDIKDCEKTISHHDDELKTVDAQIAKAEKVASEARDIYEKAKAARQPTLDDILADYSSYNDVCREVEQLTALLDIIQTQNADSELIDKLKASIEQTRANLKATNDMIATKKQHDKVKAQIDAAKTERKELQEQLDELDEQYSTAAEYDRRECEALERMINEKFAVVKWSMFAKNLDGTRKPWCECSVNGVPYSDLNTAGKVNAGLDIVNFFRRYMDIDVPCIIDGAESVLEPLYEGGQQIRLTVTEDEQLTIEQRED